MADEAVQLGNTAGVTARGGQGINGGATVGAGFDDDNMDTLNAMDARLTAINATSYSPARLRTMSYNDKKYALRVHDNPTSI